MAIKTIILFAAMAMCACADEKFHFLDHEFDRTPFGDTIDKASMKLLKEAYNEAKDKNVIASPLGVFALLSLYSAGAPGRISEEVVQYLGAANYSELIKGYSELNDQLSRINPNSLTIANKIVVSNSYELQSGNDFSRTADSMRTEVESANFEDPKAVVKSINDWAAAKTQGNIKDPVPEDAIDSSVALALFNVIYMQGHWNIPFKVENTKEEDFHLFDKTTVKKPMMRLTDALFYHENKESGFRMLELPYQEKGFRMVVVLPTENDGLSGLLEKAQKGLLEDVFNLAPSRVEISLHMPKFEIKNGLDLNSILPKVGVSAIFTDGATGIVKNAPVRVSKAFQEAFVKVDEEGATAGAFTGAIAVPMSSLYVPPPPMEFKVDHPFLFLILHEDKILFTGTYTH